MSYTGDLRKLKKEVDLIKETVNQDDETVLRNMTNEERKQRIAELLCKRGDISVQEYNNLTEDERTKLHIKILNELKAKFSNKQQIK